MNKIILCVIAGLIAAAASPSSTAGAAQGAAITPQAMPSPASGTSAQPQLTVSSRGVLLSWIERTGDLATLKFAERTASGWTDARTVASGRDWFVNWADVPSVMRLPNGTLVGHWLQKSGPDTYAYDVRLSYSKDEGKTWSPSFVPHHDGTKTEHGFASLFPLGDGLGAIWLDGRNMKSAGGHDEHGGGGVMTVHFGRFDKNWKQVEESVVDARVCECCPTAATVTSEGVIAAFRDRSDGEIRDIYTSRLVNGKWSEPAAVHADGWKIAACPVNGPALSASGRNVAASWFTVKGDAVKGEQGQAYLAFSSDAGRTYGAPIRVDDGGSLGRVDVALVPDGSAAVATWIEFADQRSQFRARRIDRTGARSAPVTIAGLAGGRSSGYPRMALNGRELVFAWTESSAGGAMQVKTATAVLPQ
ncbi:MAG: sialidase family protein [Acidobacteriota bacterium]|nr:sialidase family protein [Acidobacteriota bacterium]